MKTITKEQMRTLRKLVGEHKTIRFGVLQPDVYQTVENHTNRMLAIAPVIANIIGFNYNKNELNAFILVHDLPELGMKNDITILELATQQDASQRKDEIEKRKIGDLARTHGKWIMELFNEYKSQKSELTRFIHWTDKYESSRHIIEIDGFSEIQFDAWCVNTRRLAEAALNFPLLKTLTLKYLDGEVRPIFERYKNLNEFEQLRKMLQ
jgi:5'-deoxynucleotidase YfbR-like HD superfamily hydrolase